MRFGDALRRLVGDALIVGDAQRYALQAVRGTELRPCRPRLRDGAALPEERLGGGSSFGRGAAALARRASVKVSVAGPRWMDMQSSQADILTDTAADAALAAAAAAPTCRFCGAALDTRSSTSACRRCARATCRPSARRRWRRSIRCTPRSARAACWCSSRSSSPRTRSSASTRTSPRTRIHGWRTPATTSRWPSIGSG